MMADRFDDHRPNVLQTIARQSAANARFNDLRPEHTDSPAPQKKSWIATMGIASSFMSALTLAGGIYAFNPELVKTIADDISTHISKTDASPKTSLRPKARP